MELVYLWVEDYKNIKKQGFNFSPRFRCSYDKETEELEVIDKEETKEPYLKDFFGENVNITAIVGENGSGKSSVFELFSNILVLRNNDELNYFYVLNNGDSNICYSNNIEVLSKSITIEKNIPIEIVDGYKSIGDRNDKVALNKYFELNYLNISHLERDNIILNDSPSPENSINYYGIYAKNDIQNNYGRKNLYPIFSSFKLSQFNFLQTYEISYLLRDNKYKELFFKKFKITQPDCIEVKYIKKDLEQIKIDNTLNVDKTRVIDPSIPSIVDKIFSIVEYGSKLTIGSSQFDEFFRLVFSGSLEENFELTFQTKESKDIKLSSGEKTILFYLKRIDLMISLLNEKSNILLFDEIELYLHPNWQKRILKIILDFINENELTKKLHIIISSHSPFILSDISKENVIFLEKDEKTGNCINTSEKVDLNPFGANIHTLLSHGFFMKDGLMGEFAKNKIDEVIKYLNNESSVEIKTNDDAQSIINIIGEPIIKRELQRKLDSKRLSKIDKIDEIEKQMKIMEEQRILLEHRLESIRKNQ